MITYMSIASNLGVTIFTDSEFLPEWTMSSKLLLFLGLEVKLIVTPNGMNCIRLHPHMDLSQRIVLILKFALSSVISDTPYVVSDRLKLQVG